MAKATITVPQRTYQPGVRTVELPNLTTDDNGIEILMTRVSWPDTGGNVITGLVEGSNDNDQTRFELTEFGWPGGDLTNPRTGLPVTASGQRCYWPETYDAQGNAVPKRPGRVFVTITNTVAITTAITLKGL